MTVLESIGKLDNTLIILTSDHGEEFFDHKGWGHGHSVFQELIHIPLIVWWPEKISVPTRATQLVSHIDIAPSLYELAFDGKVSPIDGISLFKVNVKESKIDIDVSISRIGVSEFDWGNRKSISLIVGNYKYILAQKGFETRELLFDLSKDAKETINLAQQFPEKMEEFRDLMKEWKTLSSEISEKTSTPVKMDEETIKRLKSLGYIK